MRLPFRAVLAGDNSRERLMRFLNVFEIADTILVLGYDVDGAEHDKAIRGVLKYTEKKT